MNPFELSFGKEPKEYIPRVDEIEKITTSFSDGSSQCFLITGVRGSGKTVIMSHLANQYSKDKEWVVIDINPEKDILSSLVAKIYSKAKVSHLFIDKEVSIGAHGFNLTLKNGQTIVDPENVLELMVSELKRQKKKLLITIDEVTNSKEVRVFAHTFQSLIRLDLPVYLLMTGLPENVFSLQNEKTMTFLYRAPKIVLQKLENVSVLNGYNKVFNDLDLSKVMTKMVNGYAYAYQLLGSIVYNAGIKTMNESIEEEYDYQLAERSYSKIWSELGNMDKNIMRAIVNTDHTTAAIMSYIGISKEKFSVYRDRLKQKGYLDTSIRGRISIALPRFENFIKKYDI